MLGGFSKDEALSYRVWNPKRRRVMESRSVTFIETTPHLIPQPTRLSPLRELPPAELVGDYASTDDLLQDARDYTAVHDFNVNIPAEHANVDSVNGGPGREPILEQIRDVTRKDLLIPRGEPSSGGASSVKTLSGGTLPEASSPSSAPNPMPAGDQAAPAPLPAPSPAPSEAAARRSSRAASVPPCRQTRSGTTSVAALFEQAQLALARSLHQRRDAGHYSPPRECIALRRVRLRLNCLHQILFGGGAKMMVPNIFKEAMSFPQAAQWKVAKDREIATLKKHGVYELVPVSSVPA